MLPEIILCTVVAPVLLALVWVVLGMVRDGAAHARGAAGVALAAASAPFAVQVWIRGLPTFPLSGSASWFFVALVVFVGVATVLAVARQRLPTTAAWALRLVGLGAALRMVLAVPFAQDATGGTIGLLTWTAAVGFGWILLERTETRAGGGIFALVLAALAGFTALLLAAASSVTLAQVAGASALAALVVAVAAFRHPNLSLAGLTDVLWPTIGLLAWMGHHFADLSEGAIGVVMMLPALPYVVAHTSFKRAPTRAFVNAATIALGFGVALVVQLQSVAKVDTPTAVSPVSSSSTGALSETSKDSAEDEAYDPYAIGGNNDPDYDPYKPR